MNNFGMYLQFCCPKGTSGLFSSEVLFLFLIVEKSQHNTHLPTWLLPPTKNTAHKIQTDTYLSNTCSVSAFIFARTVKRKPLCCREVSLMTSEKVSTTHICPLGNNKNTYGEGRGGGRGGRGVDSTLCRTHFFLSLGQS